MAAVYWRSTGELFSRPVVAWSEATGEKALIPESGGTLALASRTGPLVQFLGLWMYGWTPSYDEMSTLLPEHVPGTPHPLAVHVTLWQNADTPRRPGGWEARLTADDTRFVAGADTLDRLEQRLGALGNHHTDRIVPNDES